MEVSDLLGDSGVVGFWYGAAIPQTPASHPSILSIDPDALICSWQSASCLDWPGEFKLY